MTIMLDLNKDSGVALDLTKHDAGISKIKVLLNWDEHPVHAASLTEGFDLDLWAFCLDANNKITAANKIVYFNNMNFGNGAVVLSADNRTGAGADDEDIIIDTAKVPADVTSIVLFVFIHEADKRGQHFGMMVNAHVDIINEDTGSVLAQYNITQQFNGQTTLAIGSVIGKTFTPEGTAGVMDPNQVLASYT